RNSSKPYEFRTTVFEALFNWRDLAEIRDILKPGDKFYLQQCRYNDTLEEIRKTQLMHISLSDSSYIHLLDHPICRSLIEWGKMHHVDIAVRSV
ncbi:MAG: anaerobic ribonucleoside-triphosphate reductase activating protein, partial [Candidatus Cloacimonadaceae bacterium]|nr:anaerobic ribonucleoside-triphosphate reductase activating protein [Candidatus Cloacimonadaceae bacterium]